MKKILIITLLLGIISKASANFDFSQQTKIEKINPWHKWGIVGLAPISTFVYGALSWWHNPKSQFHLNPSEGFFGRSSYSGGADKLGHLYASFYMAKATSYFLEQAHLPKEEALLLGSISSVIAFTSVEILDGFDQKTGAGGLDFLFNLTGPSLNYLLGQSNWLERVFRLSIFYTPSDAFLQEAKQDRNYFNISEDYNGWIFYVDFNPAQIPWIHHQLTRHVLTDFFGHLFQFSFSFKSKDFKPHGWFPELNTSLGVGVDLFSLFDFMERRADLSFGVLNSVSKYVKITPSLTMLNKSFKYKRIGERLYYGGPEHIVRR